MLPLLLARRMRHAAADLAFLDELRDAYQTWGAALLGRSARQPVPAGGTMDQALRGGMAARAQS